jgi:hypothetical protein
MPRIARSTASRPETPPSARDRAHDRGRGQLIGKSAQQPQSLLFVVDKKYHFGRPLTAVGPPRMLWERLRAWSETDRISRISAYRVAVVGDNPKKQGVSQPVSTLFPRNTHEGARPKLQGQPATG